MSKEARLKIEEDEALHAVADAARAFVDGPVSNTFDRVAALIEKLDALDRIQREQEGVTKLTEPVEVDPEPKAVTVEDVTDPAKAAVPVDESGTYLGGSVANPGL